MSKHFAPPRTKIAVKPSRIRREPVRLVEKKTEAYSEEKEIAVGVIGVLLFAAALAVLIVGISILTIVNSVATDEPAPFGQCYNSAGSDCVVDGDTIYVDHSRLQLAGIDAPGINDARCAQEKERGIASAVGLSGLLQSGRVAVGPPIHDEYGRPVRKVTVNGADVSEKMVTRSLARHYTGEPQNWC